MQLSLCRTALHWASKRGHAAIVRLLLQSGADPGVRTHNRELPVDVAATADVVQLLMGMPRSQGVGRWGKVNNQCLGTRLLMGMPSSQVFVVGGESTTSAWQRGY